MFYTQRWKLTPKKPNPPPGAAPLVANYSSHKPENTFKIEGLPGNSITPHNHNIVVVNHSHLKIFHHLKQERERKVDVGKILNSSSLLMLSCDVLINANFPEHETGFPVFPDASSKGGFPVFSKYYVLLGKSADFCWGFSQTARRQSLLALLRVVNFLNEEFSCFV